MRKYYIDNLRTAIVLSVIVYHVCYIFNGVGVLGGIPNSLSISFCDSFATFIYPWFMVLLFIISGMSSAYSLDKKSVKEFIKARTHKLLVPSTLGLFVFHFLTGMINTKMNNADLSSANSYSIFYLRAFRNWSTMVCPTSLGIFSYTMLT